MKTFARHGKALASETVHPKNLLDFLVSNEPGTEADECSKPAALPEATIKSQTKPSQLRLNFGQTAYRKCHGCGTLYDPSSPEDIALHRKVHRANQRQASKESKHQSATAPQ